jgi:hypothetical protein
MKRLLKAIYEGEIGWADLDKATLNVEQTKIVDEKHITDLIVTIKDGRKYGWTLTQSVR